MSLKLGLGLSPSPHQCLGTAMAFVIGRAGHDGLEGTGIKTCVFQSYHCCQIAQQESTTHLGNLPGGLACTFYNFRQSLHIFSWFCITHKDWGSPKFRAEPHVEPQLVAKNCPSSIFHPKNKTQSSIPMVTVSLYLFKTSK